MRETCVDLQSQGNYTLFRETFREENDVIDQPLPPTPRLSAEPNIVAQWTALYDAHTEIACLMLGSMTPELHRQFELHYPYDMVQELRSMFEKQAGVEKICGANWNVLVYMPTTWISQLGLILMEYKDFVGFVRNYNMHNMGKTIGEIHAMLIEYEKGLPKKAETPQVMMIKSGKIQKANKKSLNAKGKNKGNGKGKDKKVYIPKPNNPKPAAKERPAKDDACHHCKEVGHWKRNCPVYLAELQKKRKQVGSASSSGILGSNGSVMKQGALFLCTVANGNCGISVSKNGDSLFNAALLVMHANIDGLLKSMMMNLLIMRILFICGKIDKEKPFSYCIRKVNDLLDIILLTYVVNLDMGQDKLTPHTTTHLMEYLRRRNRTLLDMCDLLMKLTTSAFILLGFKLIESETASQYGSTRYPKETMGYYFYFPPENKLLLQDTTPSEYHSNIPQEVEGFEPPQEEVIPIRRYGKWMLKPDKTAFLNGYLDEDIYMVQPEGFVDPNHPKKVCKLQRSIYGLKQASRSWNKRFDEEIKRFGFDQNLDEPCVYQKASGSNVTFLILYVDDIIIMGNHIPSLQSVKDYLRKCFAMKYLGEATFILGIKIYRDRSNQLIGLGQNAYMDKILKRYKMDNSKRGHIPMQERLDLNKTQGASTPKEVKRMQNVPYASAVGSIMYAVRCTRPDVAFAQNITSRFQQNPGELHWTAVKNILKYLRNTKDMFLVYGGNPEAELRVDCYCNAGFETDIDDMKSLTGYMFFILEWRAQWIGRAPQQCTHCMLLQNLI
ncbi:retrotransposon protein, putative, ty1-copia subclass [Tanacetum coccineum]